QSCTKSSADSRKTWSRDAHPAGQAGASMLPERARTSATVARGGSGTMGTPSCSGHVVAAAGARWLTAVKSARHITAGVWTVLSRASASVPSTAATGRLFACAARCGELFRVRRRVSRELPPLPLGPRGAIVLWRVAADQIAVAGGIEGDIQ